MGIRRDEVRIVNGRLKQIGNKFKVERKPNRYAAVFECECGEKKVLLIDNVKKNTRSCGCLQDELLKRQNRTHGHTADKTRSTTYLAWSGMLQRVRAGKTSRCYKNYGGRGITVCDRWLVYESFLADMGERDNDKITLDRIDNDCGYCPENCRWATMKTQNRNKRNNRVVKYHGKEVTLAEACERHGMEQQVVSKRMQYGWTLEKALETPVSKLRVRKKL